MKTPIQIEVLLILAIMFFINSCKKDDDGNNIPKIVKEKVSGYVQKGPYINGTSIFMSELDGSLNQTGNIFTTQIVDNKGTFEISNIELSSQYVEFKADGFYFDEVKGEKSIAPLTLYALSDITDKTTINVNILTHLEKSRVEYLIGQEVPFTEAKDSAQKEILAMFGFKNNEIANSEALDISIDNEDNAILLAISVILQGNNSVADLTEILANISTDLREDGILNNEIIRSSFYNVTQTINLVSVRGNLEARYENLGVTATIPDFEQKINSFLISQKPFAIDDSVINVTCNGANNGSIDITVNEGTPPYTYIWSNGATTEDIGDLSPGSYSVSITDANKYILKKENILVTEPEILSINVFETHVTTIGGTDGAIDITVSGGTSPYVYNWSNGSETKDLSSISTGIYTLAVKDANNCELTQQVTIQQPVELTFDKNEVLCNGNAEGSIDMTINGGTTPYSIIWSNGEVTEDITNLKAGSYIVTVEDAYEFLQKDTIIITEPGAIEISANIIDQTSAGDDGEIDITVIGGTSPYSYSWSDGELSQDIVDKSIGQYTLTVTDDNLCTETQKFAVLGVISDFDGNQYQTVLIGSQIWMAENLKTTQYSNGDNIPEVTDAEWINLTSGAYCNYNNDLVTADTYGKLYNFYIAIDSRNVCPIGWHIPSDAEFKALEDTLGGEMIAGGKMKEEGYSHWTSPNIGATNSSGFSALPAGQRWINADIEFQQLGNAASFWTTTASGDELGWSHSLNTNGTDVFIMNDDNNAGFSVRCIID